MAAEPAKPAKPERDPLPETLRGGRYRLLGVIGSGAQAHTYDAIDTTTNRPVAVKHFSVRGARSWKDVELAEREARVLSELQHPNLPRYIEHFEEDGALYLVMEKIEGQTLAQLKRSAGSLGAPELYRFLNDAAEILGYLHGRAPAVIHRDIKPHNVIRRPDGSFALVDFGSVRDRLRSEGGSTVVGTFGYMAPEQFQGRALPASDVYGVGATVIACLTGEEPENLPHKGLAIDVKKALGSHRDPGFTGLLERLLDPDPDRRASDLDRALTEAFGKARHAAPPHSRARGEPQQRGWAPPPARPGAGAPIGPLLVVIVTLSLLVARLATFGLFRVALPVLLTLLALFFGGSLKNAAKRCIEVGLAGEDGLRRAARRIRGLDPAPRKRRKRDRYRVAPSRTYDTEGEEVEDSEHFRDRRSRRT